MLPWTPPRELAIQAQHYLQTMGGATASNEQHYPNNNPSTYNNQNHHHAIYNDNNQQQQQQQQPFQTGLQTSPQSLQPPQQPIYQQQPSQTIQQQQLNQQQQLQLQQQQQQQHQQQHQQQQHQQHQQQQQQHQFKSNQQPQQQQPQLLQQQQQQQNQLLQPNMPPPLPNQNLSGNITLPQVLHYLQSTHRTHLSLQNSWEIERAELRARVALLEGEKRSWEQAKTDLARRVRMLEWALKMERSKYLSHNQNKENTNAFTMALPPAKLAALRLADNGNLSGSDSPARAQSPKYDDATSAARPTAPAVIVDSSNAEQSSPPNPSAALPTPASTAPTHSISIAPPLPAVAAQNMFRMGTNGNGNTWNGAMTGAGMATMMGGTGVGFGTTAMGIGRDPKARARSRDYLKQCLQEINYLTSNPVLNPLPQQSALIPGIERPRKTLNEPQVQTAPNQPNQTSNFQGTSTIHQLGNNQQSYSPNPAHRPLNHTGNMPDQSQRSGLYQVSTIDNPNQPNVSSFAQYSAVGSAGSSVHPPNSTVPGAPVMTRARSSSRSLLLTPIGTNSAANDQSSTLPSGSPASSPTAVRQDNEPQNKFIIPNETASNGILNPNGISDATQPPSEVPGSEQSVFRNDGDLSALVIRDQSIGPDVETISVFDDADDTRLTAIYRPESSESWKEQLRLAGEKERLRMVNRKENEELSTTGGQEQKLDHRPLKIDEELAGLSLNEQDDPTGTSKTDNNHTNPGPSNPSNSSASDRKNSAVGGGTTTLQKGFDGYKVWKPKKTLRSHLDAARCIAFDRCGLAIVSGSDDCTVKLWRLNPASIANPSPSSWPETEPQITYRGHSATITSVAISSSPPRIYSASLDSIVSVWSLPPPEHETYAPYDPRSLLATFVGHTDAIWDMVLLPLRLRDEALLATVGADGTVKVWSTDELNSPLKLSWGYHGVPDGDSPSADPFSAEKEELVVGANGNQVKVTPTSVAVVWSDLKKVAVSYTNSVIKLFELETGKMSLRVKSDETFDGTTATQINKIVTHPTLPLLISAHEDRYIRLYDLNTGACTHSMLGHLDSVTSLSIDPTGLILVSGGHDCSIRFWDLTGSRTCLQEISSHRYKSNNEGVLDVKFHPNFNVSNSASHLTNSNLNNLPSNHLVHNPHHGLSSFHLNHLKFVASSGADGTIKIFG